MIKVDTLSVGYEERLIIEHLSVSIKEGEIISILGPNGSGKSTLLKGISRMIKKTEGKIYLENKIMEEMKSQEIAQTLSLLSQHNITPGDITVKQLVSFGRTPHKKWYESFGQEDEEIICWAMDKTGISHYKDRRVTSLSGGEKQRVWIAMSLAQQPKILLLDEPTTYLDMCHQLELMELVQDINQDLGITVVMVLHDLNQAARYSKGIILMNEGEIVAQGTPLEVLTEERIHEVYHVKCSVKQDETHEMISIYPLSVSYKKQ